MTRSAGNISLFLLALIGAALLLRALLPMPDVPEVRAKLRWLAANRHEYDTIFIGSSRVNRQIAPKTFDARMASRGLPTPSYNLGIDAMAFPELGYVLERMLEKRPPELRFVVADLNFERRKVGPFNDTESLRAVYWHDFQRTRQVCAAIWHEAARGSQSWTESIPLIGGHLQAMLRQYSNLGRGAEFIPWQRQERDKSPEQDPASHGFHPIAGSIPARQRQEYERRLAAKRASIGKPVPDDPALQLAAQEIAGRVEAVGAQPFFFIGSTINTRRLQKPQPIAGSRAVTFAFDNPARYPELYLAENRSDPQHLNSAGAELFTVLLADRIADELGLPAAAPQDVPTPAADRSELQ